MSRQNRVVNTTLGDGVAYQQRCLRDSDKWLNYTRDKVTWKPDQAFWSWNRRWKERKWILLWGKANNWK